MSSAELSHSTGYINAGGRGTRLSGLFPDGDKGVAKALLEVGEPSIKLVDHQIAAMGRAGFGNIVVAAGDQVAVHDYVRHTYANYPDVSATKSDAQHGTAGDLVLASREHGELLAKTVVVHNVDTILEIADASFVETHLSGQHVAATIALTRNRGVPNQDAFHVNKNGVVVFSLETASDPDASVLQETAWRGSSTGAIVVGADYLRNYDWTAESGQQLSLYRDVMGGLIDQGAVGAYDNGTHFFKDVGTIASWHDTVRTGNIQPYLCYDGAQTRQSVNKDGLWQSQL